MGASALAASEPCQSSSVAPHNHATGRPSAALDTASGKVLGSLHRRHRTAKFKKFLSKLDGEVPDCLDVHLIVDNHGAYKTAPVRRWLLAHPPPPALHPTGSSWLNLVERWFAELIGKKLQRSVNRSVPVLERGIRSWIKDWNADPRPYVWHKTVGQILNSLAG
ncbi:transposase [Streptomyces sp. NPDC002922]|uniref:transposase n=1 Tax=Streptomyces sp. NPDC002922 TaxID=3154439 RepID=UPI0033B70B5B